MAGRPLFAARMVRSQRRRAAVWLQTAFRRFADSWSWEASEQGTFLAAARASRRAENLLLAWLTPQQRDQYMRSGEFDVRGSLSRKRYRISAHQRAYNVAELDGDDRVLARYCFGPIGAQADLPMGDVMLAQKLALELNEYAALSVANARIGAETRSGDGIPRRIMIG